MRTSMGIHLHHNERLELGDSVLGFVTADYLFTHYPDLPEGELIQAARGGRMREGAFARSRGNSVFWNRPAGSVGRM